MADLVQKVLVAGLVVIVVGFIGWIIQVAFPWVFQNATGGYDSSSRETLATNLPLIFLGVGVLIAVIYLLMSVQSAAKK